MSETKRPAGMIASADLISLAARKYPGTTISSEMLDAVATLSGLPRWTRATEAGVRQARVALASAESVRARRAADAHDLERIKARFPNHVPKRKD